MAETFAEVLAVLVADFGGSKKAFAEAAGITPQRLSHHLKPGKYTAPPGIELCLRIAKAGNGSAFTASRLLRAAGKPQIADLIEGLYGKATLRRGAISLSPPERLLVQRLRTRPRVQRNVLLLVEQIFETPTEKKQQRRHPTTNPVHQRSA